MYVCASNKAAERRFRKSFAKQFEHEDRQKLFFCSNVPETKYIRLKRKDRANSSVVKKGEHRENLLKRGELHEKR